jgi:hypothetical protein
MTRIGKFIVIVAISFCVGTPMTLVGMYYFKKQQIDKVEKESLFSLSLSAK